MAPKFLVRLAQALRLKKTPGKQAGSVDTFSSKKPFGIGDLVHSRYQMEAEIGRGGMGIVYRARDIPMDREVAFKIINLDKANMLSLYQFSREAAIASRLEHPHIVRVLEIGTLEAGGHLPSPYMVMELVDGTGLDELHGFTYRRIIEIGKQICEALIYAHNQGYVHRDLKPGNVLVEKRGFQYSIKLMDFGLARPLGAGNLPAESNTAGTIFYLAPEVIAGKPADVSSDLYALGAMLYEMITGRVPFSDFIDDQAILAQHLEEAVAPPSHSREDVPPTLEAIVLRLLEKDPKDRFSSAEEVRQALEKVEVRVEAELVKGNLPDPTGDAGHSESQVAQVSRLLEANKLVTILGEGEALALATGQKLSEQFTDGVWRLDLASLTDPTSLLPAVAALLCVRVQSQRSQAVSLIGCLRESHLLLILSHCDALRRACAQFVETVLQACPEVYVLATGQHPLQVLGETCYQVSAG